MSAENRKKCTCENGSNDVNRNEKMKNCSKDSTSDRLTNPSRYSYEDDRERRDGPGGN